MNLIRAFRGFGIATSALVLLGLWIPAEDSSAQVQQPPPPIQRRSGLEERVQLLTAELGLDAAQQSAVRTLLLDQREQVMKVWSDPSIPAGYRIGATRAISDRTADRIRALLNDVQKAKYIAPRKPRETQAAGSKATLEDWMNAASPK